MSLKDDLKQAISDDPVITEDHPMRPLRRRAPVALIIYGTAVVLLLVGVPLVWWLSGQVLGG